MSAVETAAIAYLLIGSTGNDLSKHRDNASVEVLRDRGLVNGDCQLTELGRKRARLITQYAEFIECSCKEATHPSGT